jgi:hypothetical protein
METDDLTDVFDQWTVIDKSSARWLCRCVCGTTRRVPRYDVMHGKSKGCGCVRRVALPKAAKAANTTHGLGDSTEMRIWADMKRRCHSPHRPDYKRYGARGITVCEEWRNSFEAFLRDMGRRPKGCTLDRKDNDAGYSPSNCRWLPNKAQGRNRRTNVLYAFAGEQITLAEIADRTGINVNTIRSRLGRGWTLERAAERR